MWSNKSNRCRDRQLLTIWDNPSRDLNISVFSGCLSSLATHLTSVSMIFSIYSTVRNWGWPVTGHGTSSVRRTIFSSRIFSRSRITMGPSLDLIAIFGKTITSLVLKFQEKNNTNKIEYINRISEKYRNIFWLRL